MSTDWLINLVRKVQDLTEAERKRMGRPKVENPKKTASFKLDVSDIEHLEKYSNQEKISKSEAVRRGINKLKLK